MPKKVVNTDIISMIKKGISLNKIKAQKNIGKSTLYYHYKKIKGKKYKPIELNFFNDSELGEFLGIFAGDGYFILNKNYHYNIRIYTGYYETGYIRYINKALTKWFNKKPQLQYLKYKGKISAVAHRYDSKRIYDLLKEYLYWEGKKTYTIKLKKFSLNNKDFNIGFVRGLIDTDGNYYPPKRRLSFSSVSKELAQQYYKIAKENLKLDPKFNIIHSKRKNQAILYTVALHGLNAKKAIEIIKPNNPNKTMR